VDDEERGTRVQLGVDQSDYLLLDLLLMATMNSSHLIRGNCCRGRVGPYEGVGYLQSKQQNEPLWAYDKLWN